MSKSKLRPAPIKTKILMSVRDNPGLRPFQLFALPVLAEHRVSWFWLRVLQEDGLVFDENQADWWKTFEAWCAGAVGPNPRCFRRVSLKLTAKGEAWLAARV